MVKIGKDKKQTPKDVPTVLDLIKEGYAISDKFVNILDKLKKDPKNTQLVEELYKLVDEFKELAELLDLDRARHLVPTLKVVLSNMKHEVFHNNPEMMEAYYRAADSMREIFDEVASGKWQITEKKGKIQ
jgi:chemotaxis protein histidine kinase CheA